MSSPSLAKAIKPEISLDQHSAVIFDLDGVVTKTARVHARAWKKMFDVYLKLESKKRGVHLSHFDEERDYTLYLDGKPRYDGVRDFLASRGCSLPEGNPNDEPGKETICGLGNLKDDWFQQELNESGIEVFASTITLIKKLRNKGVKTAIISSSKNCTPILKLLGLTDLFDIKIDGVDSAERGIQGKPAPDIFLIAASELGIEPRHAVVVEDAVSGVMAGREGKFALVIGVDRRQKEELLYQNGAHVVVKDLEEVSLVGRSVPLPNALVSFRDIVEEIEGKRVVIFLDYDGTLTPIVSHPDLACIDGAMQALLQKLKDRFAIGVISGRDVDDLKSKIQIQGLLLAGSHGFDILGPAGERFENDEAELFNDTLEAAEDELRSQLAGIDGAFVERKRFTIACHYRLVSPLDWVAVEQTVDRIHSNHPELRKTYGKKVFELQPNIAWDKGRALQTLLDLFGLQQEDVFPLYIGDDTTDEEAFRAIANCGVGVCIQDHPRATLARFTLRNVSEVQRFLTQLLTI